MLPKLRRTIISTSPLAATSCWAMRRKEAKSQFPSDPWLMKRFENCGDCVLKPEHFSKILIPFLERCVCVCCLSSYVNITSFCICYISPLAAFTHQETVRADKGGR